MTAEALLAWVRGPGMQIALGIFFLGITIRIVEMMMIGRKPDLAVARKPGTAAGWRTIFHRSLPTPGMMHREPLVFLGGYIFHVGFFLVLLFSVPHIELFHGVWGFRWPGLPRWLIDISAILSIGALVCRPGSPFSVTQWRLSILGSHHLAVDYRLLRNAPDDAALHANAGGPYIKCRAAADRAALHQVGSHVHAVPVALVQRRDGRQEGGSIMSSCLNLGQGSHAMGMRTSANDADRRHDELSVIRVVRRRRS